MWQSLNNARLLTLGAFVAGAAFFGGARPACGQTLYLSKGSGWALATSTWNGSAWSTPTTFSGPTSVRWLQIAQSTARDEVAIVCSDDSSAIRLLFRSAGSHTAPTTIQANSNAVTMRKFAVAYEQTSGDCLVAYSTGTSLGVASRTGSAASMSGATSVMVANTEFNTIALYPKPGSDEILLLAQDANHDLRACLWNGSGWGSVALLTANLKQVVHEVFAAAYQGSSGTPMVVYGLNGSNIAKYRTYSYTAAAWSAEANMPATNDDPYYVRLVAKTSSNEVLCGILDASKRIYASRWNGSSWSSATMIADNTQYEDRRCFDIAYEPDESHALIVYGDNDESPAYRTWDGSAWSSASSAGDAGGRPCFVQLSPAGSGNQILVTCSTDSGALKGWQWNGTSGAIATIEASPGSTYDSEYFDALSAVTAATAIRITSWREVSR